MYPIKKLYSLEHTLVSDYLLRFEYLWKILSGRKKNIASLTKILNDSYGDVKECVWIHKNNVFAGVYIGLSCAQDTMLENSIFKNSGIVVQKD